MSSTRRPDPDPATGVAVVGGGMLGLVVALRLAQAGRAVTVVEAGSRVGGLAAPWELDGEHGPVTWDRFYHVTLASDAALRALLAEVGLEAQVRWRTTRTGYWDGHRLVSASTPAELMRLPGLSPWARARLGATLLAGMRIRDPTALERIPVRRWLERWSGPVAFARFWRPLLEAKLGGAWPDANAAFIWATIQRLTAARRAGLRREELGYVPGGYATVLGALEDRLRRLGVDVRTGAAVTRVETTPAGMRVHHAAGAPVVAGAVVLTTTPGRAAALIDGLTPDERRTWAGIRYQGVVCASLLLRRPLSPYYLTYLVGETPFTAVVEMTALVDPAELGGHHLVYLPRYASADEEVFAASDAELIDGFLDGLRRIHPGLGTGDVVATRVARAAEVFPIPVLGASARIPPVVTSVPGVYLATSAQIRHGTLNVNETVGAAERAAAEILAAERGAAPPAAPSAVPLGRLGPRR
jgi:protoporphyrinogen oxidase